MGELRGRRVVRRVDQDGAGVLCEARWRWVVRGELHVGWVRELAVGPRRLGEGRSTWLLLQF